MNGWKITFKSCIGVSDIFQSEKNIVWQAVIDSLLQFSQVYFWFTKLECLLPIFTVGMPNGRSDILPENVVQFGNMISCTTGLNQFQALMDYDGYGCYCGLGGGGTPLDNTDKWVRSFCGNMFL